MIKIFKGILAISMTLFLGGGMFYCLISGITAVQEGKTGSYITMCALLCTGLMLFLWGGIWYIFRLRKREKELEEQIEILIKQSNKNLPKQTDKLDK